MRLSIACCWFALVVLGGCENDPSRRALVCADASNGTGQWVRDWGAAQMPRNKPMWDGERIQSFNCNERCQVCRYDVGPSTTQCSKWSDVQLLSVGFAGTQDFSFVIGGVYPASYSRDGSFENALLYDWAAEEWMVLEPPDYFEPGETYEVHWTGTEFIAWGTSEVDEEVIAKLSGFAFDPVAEEWRELPKGGPSTPGSTLWTDAGLFVWPYEGPSGMLLQGDEWAVLAEDGHPRVEHQHLATDGRRVFVAGGTNGKRSDWYQQLDIYDTKTHTWQHIDIPPDMHTGKSTWVDDRLFMGDWRCSGVSFYKPDDGTWGVTPSGGPEYPATGPMLAADGALVQFGQEDHYGETNGELSIFRPE